MAPKTLSILCFGDSLTSGYYAMGLESHPYSIAFAAKVQEALPDTKLQVYTNGKAGDVATFEPFQQRLEAECELSCTSQSPSLQACAYQLTAKHRQETLLRLGRHSRRNKVHPPPSPASHIHIKGIKYPSLTLSSDLAYMVPPSTMYKGFQFNWGIPLSKGSKVLALTIPESQTRSAWVVQNRSEINASILNHKQSN
jgi:hypothetical protein